MSAYEVINPSDPVTFEAPDDVTAAAAVLILGRGAYACESEDGRSVLPILLFGGDAWLEGEGAPVLALAKSEEARGRIADALDTMAVVRLSDRAALVAAVGPDPAALARWSEAKRSSLNNIVGSARRLATSLRRPAEQRA